jgi:hypothetical protein
MSTIKVLQACDRGSKGENLGNWDGYLAYPNYHELKYEVYTSLIHSAKGIVYFSFYRCNSIDVFRNIKTIWSEIMERNYLKILNTTKITDQVSYIYDGPLNTKNDSEIHGEKLLNGKWKYPQYGGDHSGFPESDINFSFHAYKGDYYLFVVNDSNSQKDRITFRFPFTLANVKNLESGFDLPMDKNSFICSLSPYDSVVFLIKARDK